MVALAAAFRAWVGYAAIRDWWVAMAVVVTGVVEVQSVICGKLLAR